MKQLNALRERGKNRIWTLCAVLFVSACFALFPMWFACVMNRTAIFISYFQTPLIALLNILPIVWLGLLLYFAIGRAWIAGLITGLFSLGISFANYYKISFRNDPIIFEDLTLLREAGNMASAEYDLFLNKSMLLALALTALAVVFLWLFAGGTAEKKPRLISLAALLLLAIPTYRNVYCNWDIYANGTRNEAHINKWSEAQVFYSKGFVYPFLYSVHTASDPAPDGYDEAAMREVLAQYEDAEIPLDARVDVISIMLEAYSDFESLGIEGISEQVYAPLREIQSRSLSGTLMTNIFAGGTVNTERAFLTGFSNLGSFRSYTNAYPWYFRANGYETEGAHPCYAWFYNRQNINENLGFQTYYFAENRYDTIQPDSVFLADVKALYRQHCAQKETPYFAYHLTYQGHGPYSTSELAWGEGHFAQGNYSDEAYYAMNNYLGSVKNTGENLLAMLDQFQTAERPLVLVVFGDHKPWMGDGNSIYDELGVNFDLSSEEGYRNYYETPYFIWANDAAKAVLHNEFVGESETLSPCFLMHKLFDECGWTGNAYMQATRAVYERSPVMTDKGRYVLADGTFTTEMPTEVQQFQYLEYFYRKNFIADS